MRRLVALPLLFLAASLVVAFPGTTLGAAADRLACDLAHWAGARA